MLPQKEFLSCKSWERELPKILMAYRATPHSVSSKIPTMLLFDLKICMRTPHVDSKISNTTNQNIRTKCQQYQSQMKTYHDAKNHATLHTFDIVVLYFAQT